MDNAQSDVLIQSAFCPARGETADILIRHGRIAQIGANLPVPAGAHILDGSGKAIIPGMINMHTHSAMTLFRGCGESLPLMRWLEEVIWPRQAKLRGEDIYWGAKLACLEMIKSGTTAFLDMHRNEREIARAADEMGIRANISLAIYDRFDAEETERQKRRIADFFAREQAFSPRIQFSLGPHAPYTVSAELLRWLADFAREHDILLHIHAAETEAEAENAQRDFGATPIHYLHRLGILSPRAVLAHALYADDEDLRILADSGANIVHNPAANMALGSGLRFRFAEMRQAGIPVALGTDGSSPSGALDMQSAMRLASLTGKGWRKNAEILPAAELLDATTRQAAAMLRLDCGRVEAGALADICLVDLRSPAFTPNFNFAANFIYSANASCIDTVICNGKILMQNRAVAGEAEILAEAEKAARDLMRRA